MTIRKNAGNAEYLDVNRTEIDPKYVFLILGCQTPETFTPSRPWIRVSFQCPSRFLPLFTRYLHSGINGRSRFQHGHFGHLCGHIFRLFIVETTLGRDSLLFEPMTSKCRGRKFGRGRRRFRPFEFASVPNFPIFGVRFAHFWYQSWTIDHPNSCANVATS